MALRGVRDLSSATLSALLIWFQLGRTGLGYSSVPLTQRPLGLDVACPLPVDDKAESWRYRRSLWTHQPECEHSMDRTARYCAYTNAQHGSRGWSVVTSPETAADSVSFLSLSPPLKAPSLTSDSHGAPYKVVEMPGKGRGLVAVRDIKQYEEILLDYATLLVDIEFTTKVPAVLGYRLLHAAVDRLSDPASVLDLGQSNGFAQDVVENVVRTNAFHTNLGEVPHLAVYPAVSRINHACKPNAYTRFMPETLQVSVAAARDIPTGEEISISYIPLGQPTPERQRRLHKWGFTCTCSLCSAPEAEREASDARRREIERLRDDAVRAFQAGRPYTALRLTKQVLALLPAEGLFPLYSEQYENMARIFYVVRDMENAERYANMSLGVLREQGYVGEVGREMVEGMWRRFEDEEGGRY
ncbi:SET domain-containing protein [Parathielavia appendiculata]|uniref:SET domain-containing protein n=1 Tax=Parathielavia appendiculata TaxID=2587402 RepID=A0AAN6U0S6_9PEZI|nr:SET domain-containing protein [Parathielavia appendiculata]